VLFEWMSWLREYLEDNVKKPIDHEEEEEGLSKSMSILHVEEQQEESDYHPENDDISDEKEEDKTHDRPTVRSLMGSNVYHTEKPPTIFSSEPLLDRKSTFVAHVAQVHSVHDVKVVIAHLLQNKKIAKATHNILAYRITMPDGKVLQDNDDDGESAAGGRLSHLMQILEVENVVVVVTRWFGGIHLGPDRFKDINNVSRNALETFGFIKSKSNTKGNKTLPEKKTVLFTLKMADQPHQPHVEIEATGLTGDIIKSIMTPGYTANGVINIMFYAFYALFATLLFMLFITKGNPHVITFLLLAICLFVSIKWFIAEFERSKKLETKAQ
ncbi:hypothetical protein CU098_010176, partial [Rhizopus stolonifer]